MARKSPNRAAGRVFEEDALVDNSPENRVKVLHISGYGGSGTTMIGQVFDQVEGLFHIGQFTDIWGKYHTKHLCACKTPFRECPLWSNIFQTAYGSLDGIDAQQMKRWRNLSRTRSIPKMLFQGPERWLSANQGDYPKLLGKVYQTIQQISGCQLIVDTSKDTFHDYILRSIPEIDLYTVHLIRDPRGVGYSRLKRKKPMIQGWLSWVLFNRSVEGFGRRYPAQYQRLRYEDFLKDTRGCLEKILTMTGHPQTSLDFVQGNRVQMQGGHAIDGNRMRFRVGELELKPDEEWRDKLSAHYKAVCWLITGSKILKYGYLDKQ
ncbi:MAG: sulfotransferase domain-containing protein [Fimbriimonadia bacterium]|nr:sulfotransferase domain-containing protein [Fimbriimonadia bacterium]